MMETIANCQILLARGMGSGAYKTLKQVGLEPILTDIQTIDEVIHACLQGNLADHPERLH